MDLAAVLTTIAPTAQWSLNGNDYSELTWLSLGQPPSEAECDAAWPAVQNAQALTQVRANRHSAYIAESDPLFFGWQRGENTEVVWLSKVQEIRNRFPEPTDA